MIYVSVNVRDKIEETIIGEFPQCEVRYSLNIDLKIVEDMVNLRHIVILIGIYMFV